jgi:hypothetical protein
MAATNAAAPLEPSRRAATSSATAFGQPFEDLDRVFDIFMLLAEVFNVGKNPPDDLRLHFRWLSIAWCGR